MLRLAVLAALAYVAVTYGWPWMRQRLGEGRNRGVVDPDSGNAQALSCVAQAERALEDFREKAASLGTSQVQLNWREAMRLTQAEIEAAQRACRCDSEACVEAADAVATLGATKDSFTVTVRGGGTPRDVSSGIARVESQLQQARRLLGP